MSASKRRRRRERSQTQTHTMEELVERDEAGPQRPPGPQWNWRTFPVYFAFALGAFVGLYVGLVTEVARQNGEGIWQAAAFIAIAIMLGLGLSRLTTRWLVTRRWVRQRATRKQARQR